MGPEAKGYTCKQCGEAFATSQALAGHANHHRRSSNGPRAGKPRPGHQRADGKAPPAAQPARKPPDEHGVPCPLCCQSLPASLGVLIQQFEREGVDEDLATRLAAKAYGLLHIPS